MDTVTFEEIVVGDNVVGDRGKWIAEGSTVTLIDFKGSIIEVQVPSPNIYVVTDTEPNMKGNTAQGYTKPAVLDCGATIQIPGFLEIGAKIKVDTDKGEYMERVTGS
jgi:elongation factor P